MVNYPQLKISKNIIGNMQKRHKVTMIFIKYNLKIYIFSSYFFCYDKIATIQSLFIH